MARPLPCVDGDRPFEQPNADTDTRGGLLAHGGDLTPKRMLAAYHQGIFPWFNPGEAIFWWTPNPRAVLLPGQFQCPRRLSRKLRNLQGLRFSVNVAFGEVLHGCAASNGRRDHTWLGRAMRDAYSRLHALGHCHSFEAWSDDTLLGGVIFIKFGSYVAGETMFFNITDGSKIALAGLCQLMRPWPYALLDCQVVTAHLLQLGALQVRRDDFLARLRRAAGVAGARLDPLTVGKIRISPQGNLEQGS